MTIHRLHTCTCNCTQTIHCRCNCTQTIHCKCICRQTIHCRCNCTQIHCRCNCKLTKHSTFNNVCLNSACHNGSLKVRHILVQLEMVGPLNLLSFLFCFVVLNDSLRHMESWFTQMRVILFRTFLSFIRDPGLIRVRIMQVMVW